MGPYKNSASAAAAWNIIRKKILAKKDTSTEPSTSAPKGAQGKPEAETHDSAMENAADDHEGGGEFTPINTPKKKQAGKAKNVKVKPEIEADGEELATPKSKKGATKVKLQTEADGEEITDPKPKKRVTKKKVEAHDEGEEVTTAEAGTDVKMETETGDNGDMAPAASGNVVTPSNKGKKAIMKPDEDDSEVKKATPTPTKKRVRKQKEDGKPNPKRNKASTAAADKVTNTLGNQNKEETPHPIASSSLGEEGNRDEVMLSADLEGKMYKSASEHSRILAEAGSGTTQAHDALTPPADTENDQEANEDQPEET